jgi:hypothetical protein
MKGTYTLNCSSCFGLGIGLEIGLQVYPEEQRWSIDEAEKSIFAHTMTSLSL